MLLLSSAVYCSIYAEYDHSWAKKTVRFDMHERKTRIDPQRNLRVSRLISRDTRMGTNSFVIVLLFLTFGFRNRNNELIEIPSEQLSRPKNLFLSIEEKEILLIHF